MTRNNSQIFAAIPSGFPKPGEHIKLVEGTIDLEAPLKEGEILTKTLSLSLDPYLRGRMRAPEIKTYSEPYHVGQPMSNFGVGEVVVSANPNFKKGDKVYGEHKFSEYNIFSAEASKGLKILENKEKLPWTTWVGAAGMPGQTAWHGLTNIAKPKKGETIFVSGASGAVGQMVIALSQQMGLKIIGSAGSDDKVAFLKDTLKIDIAFNYKKTETSAVLKENPIDIYWDNVGGPTLDAALDAMNWFGRIVACGQISTYNGEEYGVKGTGHFFAKSLMMQGFIILHHDLTGFYKTIPGMIASGEIKPPKEHIVKGLDNGEVSRSVFFLGAGIDSYPVFQAFYDLLTGGNFGKAVISLE
ncbi:hypothetical protein P7C70_g5209, partial [Phenoliferia sp. Uapishka_3]